MGLPFFDDHPKLRDALIFGIWGGAVNVAVDADHWFTYVGILGARPFHVPLLIIAVGVAVCCCACCRRLLVRVVLRRVK